MHIIVLISKWNFLWLILYIVLYTIQILAKTFAKILFANILNAFEWNRISKVQFNTFFYYYYFFRFLLVSFLFAFLNVRRQKIFHLIIFRHKNDQAYALILHFSRSSSYLVTFLSFIVPLRSNNTFNNIRYSYWFMLLSSLFFAWFYACQENQKRRRTEWIEKAAKAKLIW